MAPNKENLSAVLYGAKDLRMVKREVPEPGEYDVLLRMGSVGICGTDVSFLTKGYIGDMVVKEPMLLGHEASGTVVKCGAKVTNLKPGDRVTIDPGMACGRCSYCRVGRSNLCTAENQCCGLPPVNGYLCQYHAHSAVDCYKLPDHVGLEEAAFLEPLSCSLHAVQRAGVTLGSRVLVCGAGPIGLISMKVARAMGATDICVTDVVESRLEFAKKQGANSSVLVKPGTNERELADAVKAAMGGRRPDRTIECSGAESSIRLAILATESGGVVVLVGLGPAEVKVPIVDAAIREVDIRGIFRYGNYCFPLSVAMVASGQVDLKPLITHRFALADSLEAFETVRTGAGGALKVMINCEQ